MTASRAVAFRAAADARYRRTSRVFVAVRAVLRTPPRPMRIENHIRIDARTLRIVARARRAGVLTPARLAAREQPVVARLLDRARREGTQPVPAATVSVDTGSMHDVRARRSQPAVLPPARAVAMVLARAGGSPPTVTATTAAVSARWPSEGPTRDRPHANDGFAREDELSGINVARLTERVVAAIDRRMTAARERFGG